tara:strand:+ start:2327 stop:3367 length:1041 start_codon:yes stop_codon:yes gene_type:complete
MTLKFADSFVKGHLFVGETVVTPVGFGIGPTKLQGAAYVAGPIMVGDPVPFMSPPGVPQATTMITKRSQLTGLVGSAGLALQNLGLIPSPSICIISNSPQQPTPLPTDVLVGTPVLPVGVTVNTGISFFTVMTTASNTFATSNIGEYTPYFEKIASYIKEVGQKLFIGTKTELGVDKNVALALNDSPILSKTIIKCSDVFSSSSPGLNKTYAVARSKKSFDIPHPTKDDHRLRHVCPESPRADVYVRGKLRNGENVIQLPEYWKELVNPESIDVFLTPIGSYQELFVKEIQWGSKVVVRNNAGGPIDCSYMVYGERKDVAPTIAEYKGLTEQDYPGDNEEYNVNGL